MTQTLEELADLLAAHCRNPQEMLEHLRAVERAATKAAYERAALAVDAMRDPAIGFGWNATLREAAHTIRALADGGSDGTA